MSFEDKVRKHIQTTQDQERADALRREAAINAAQMEVDQISSEIVALLEKYNVPQETVWELIKVGEEIIPGHPTQGKFGTRITPETSVEIMRYQEYGGGWILHREHEYNDPEFPYVFFVLFQDGTLFNAGYRQGIKVDKADTENVLALGNPLHPETALLILQDSAVTQTVAELIQGQ